MWSAASSPQNGWLLRKNRCVKNMAEHFKDTPMRIAHFYIPSVCPFEFSIFKHQTLFQTLQFRLTVQVLIKTK